MSKYAVVTGASSGIGFETAKLLAARGFDVIAVARRQARLEELREQIVSMNPDRRVIPQVCDLTDRTARAEFYAVARKYPLKIWINNAGIGSYGAVSEIRDARLYEQLELDVAALCNLSIRFVRDFGLQEGTQLINVASAGGYAVVENAVIYCAAKFFAVAFTEGLAAELARLGSPMQVKVFAPAATETEFGKRATNAQSYEYPAHFPRYHSAREAAAMLWELCESDHTVGCVDRTTFEFRLTDPVFPQRTRTGR